MEKMVLVHQTSFLREEKAPHPPPIPAPSRRRVRELLSQLLLEIVMAERQAEGKTTNE
jgi:hypothetical protein